MESKNTPSPLNEDSPEYRLVRDGDKIHVRIGDFLVTPQDLTGKLSEHLEDMPLGMRSYLVKHGLLDQQEVDRVLDVRREGELRQRIIGSRALAKTFLGKPPSLDEWKKKNGPQEPKGRESLGKTGTDDVDEGEWENF